MHDHTRIFLPVFQAGGGFCQRDDGLVISAQFHHGSQGHSSPEIVSLTLIDNVPENDIPRIRHALGLPNDFQANGVTYEKPDGMTIAAQYQQETGPVPKLLFLLDIRSTS